MPSIKTTIISVSEYVWTAVTPRVPSWRIEVQQQPNTAVTNWVATAAFFLGDPSLDGSAPQGATGAFRPPGENRIFGIQSVQSWNSQLFRVQYELGLQVAWLRLPSGGGTVNFQQIEQYAW